MTINKKHSDHCCDEMNFFLYEKKVSIRYSPRFREYSILLGTGGAAASQTMRYCPWCGQKLPMSLRDECAAELEKMGFNIFDDNIPDRYKTDEWWQKKHHRLETNGATGVLDCAAT